VRITRRVHGGVIGRALHSHFEGVHLSVIASSSERTAARRRRQALFAVTVLGLALVFGMLEAAQGRFLYHDLPNTQFWPEALARSMPSWLVLAVLTPLVFALARAMPLDGRRWPRTLPVHVIAGAVFVVLHLGGAAVAASWRHHWNPAILESLDRFLYRYAAADYFVYWALAGLGHVVHHHAVLRAREVAEAELRASLAEARLTALQGQLNPHFLFNALNAISALALTDDRPRLLQTIDALSGLLRSVLDESANALTSLGGEVRLLDRYLAVQEVRFGDRLRLERTIPDELLDATVPSLLLLPLVENSIVHAVGRTPGPMRVSIRASREGADLCLEVRDSGPGFAAGQPDPHGRGVGIANTRKRLEQLYGVAHAITFGNASSGGAIVSVRLPWTPWTGAAAPGTAASPA
jgi:two-component system LytT family sensor kinase